MYNDLTTLSVIGGKAVNTFPLPKDTMLELAVGFTLSSLLVMGSYLLCAPLMFTPLAPRGAALQALNLVMLVAYLLFVALTICFFVRSREVSGLYTLALQVDALFKDHGVLGGLLLIWLGCLLAASVAVAVYHLVCRASSQS